MFESRLGRLDYADFQQLLDEDKPDAARAYIARIEGPLGLLVFNVIDHGSLLKLSGKTAQAKQYVVGNPLIALQMTSIDVRAGLYVPLRVFIKEDGSGKSAIEYDLPSSLFGQFENAEIDRVAKMLDQKLDAAVDSCSPPHSKGEFHAQTGK